MNKQPIAWLLAASLSVMQTAPAIAVTVSAAEQSAETLVSAGSARGKQGETVSVSISLKGNRGLNAMAVWVKYDTEALELVSVSDKGRFGADAFDAPKTLSKSPVRLGWTNSGKANTGDGTVAVLEFRIKDTAPNGSFDIELYTKSGENFTADFSAAEPFTDVELAFDSGKITVDGGEESSTAASEDSPAAPSISKVSVSGFIIKLPKGYEYTYSETKTDSFKGFKWYRNKSARELKPNTLYYVYQRDTATGEISAPAEIVTSKYSIEDAIESISIGTGGAEGTVLRPVITYRDGFSAETVGKLTYCWSAKDWAEPSVSMADSYTVTAEDTANGREMNVTIAAQNCKGLLKSNSFTAGRAEFSDETEINMPVIREITSDGFVIAADAGYEYTISEDGNIPENAEWTSLDSDAAITGKNAGRTYFVTVRVKATDTVNASDPSAPVSVRIPANDPSLLELTVSGAKLTPEFSPDITDYTAAVPYGKDIPRIKTITAAGGSAEETEQAKGFADGKNKTVIKVTAENGEASRLYTVTFIRQEGTVSADSTAENTADASHTEADSVQTEPVSAVPDIASNGSVEPCVSEAPEKSGWSAVYAELLAAADGETVTVRMNDTTELPEEIESCIKNRNVNLVLKMENGVSWTINGMNIEKPSAADMEVSTAPRKSLADLADSLSSERKAIPVKLYQSGGFGFSADLTVELNDRYNGYCASLYSRSRKTGDAEYISSSTVENGKARISFSKYSDSSEYAVIFTSEPVTEDISSNAGIAVPSVPADTGAMPADPMGLPLTQLPDYSGRRGKKRRYRIVRKRRLEDTVFVL